MRQCRVKSILYTVFYEKILAILPVFIARIKMGKARMKKRCLAGLQILAVFICAALADTKVARYRKISTKKENFVETSSFRSYG